MRTIRRSLSIAMVVTLVSATLGAADDSTTGLLKAVRVKTSLRIQPAGDSVLDPKLAELEYALAESPEAFSPLTADVTFVGTRPIKVAYPKMNPLAVQVTASLSSAPDPANAALGRFVEAILKIPKLLGDEKHASVRSLLQDCPRFKELVTLLRNLEISVTRNRTIDTKLVEWRNTMDAQPGFVGARLVSQAIGAKAKEVQKDATDARTTLALIRTLATSMPQLEDARKRQAIAEQTVLDLKAKEAAAATAPNKAKGGVPARPAKPAPNPAAAPGTTTQPAAPETPAAAVVGSCDLDLLLPQAFIYILGTGDVDARILELDDLADDLLGLQASLTPYTKESNWEGNSYIFATVPPAPEEIKTLSVAIAPVSLTSVPSEGVVKTVGKKTSSGKVVIRQFSTFAPEIGAGVVVSTVRRPSYGTTKTADGTTVVARKSDENVSVSGAVMLNSVCRCGMDSFAYPMFQVGALADSKSPGILFGTGIRFIRPKHIGLAGGAALVWIKDLDKLSVGAPVGGTTDIDNDLKFKPTVKLYFTFQYNF